MGQARNRRRRIIVDSELQRRIVFAGAWPPCLGMGVAILLLGYLCTRLGAEALEAGVELPSLVWLFLVMAVLLMMAMGFVVWASLRISHRVAGPTQNIRGVLGRVRGGELSARIRLRDGDYLDAVADLINEHLVWLEQHAPPGMRAPDAPSHADEPSMAASTASASPSDRS